jgi:hypothetical protein
MARKQTPIRIGDKVMINVTIASDSSGYDVGYKEGVVVRRKTDNFHRPHHVFGVKVIDRHNNAVIAYRVPCYLWKEGESTKDKVMFW